MGRNGALDGVRALAALAVIVHHSQIRWPSGGFIGVDLFFVLSGFLITSLLMREAEATGSIAIGGFLLRRALRLMPPLLMLLAAVSMIGPHFWPDEPLGLEVVIAGLYLGDYVYAMTDRASVLGHTWSLAVEEHFYLIWPLAAIGLACLHRRSRLKVLIVAFVVATLWRLGNAYHYPQFEMTAFRFDTRLSGLVLGALIAVSDSRLRGRAADAVGVASLAALAILATVSTQDPVFIAWLQPLIDIAAGGLIMSIVAGKKTITSRAFAWSPLPYFGLISYSLYLWHYPISRAAMMHTNDWRVILLVTLALSIPIAAMSYAFVEKPLQTWRLTRYAPA